MRVTATPMIGLIKDDRTGSLSGCHALNEHRSVQFANTPKEFNLAVAKVVKDVMLAERAAALGGKMNIIITLELEENGR